jgi:hypothetical protein
MRILQLENQGASTILDRSLTGSDRLSQEESGGPPRQCPRPCRPQGPKRSRSISFWVAGIETFRDEDQEPRVSLQ